MVMGERSLGDLNLYADMQSFIVWMITTEIAKEGDSDGVKGD